MSEWMCVCAFACIHMFVSLGGHVSVCLSVHECTCVCIRVCACECGVYVCAHTIRMHLC